MFLMKAKSDNKDSPGLLELLEEIIGTASLKDQVEVVLEELNDLTDKKIEFGERVRITRSNVE